jgi:hypothetical protein
VLEAMYGWRHLSLAELLRTGRVRNSHDRRVPMLLRGIATLSRA